MRTVILLWLCIAAVQVQSRPGPIQGSPLDVQNSQLPKPTETPRKLITDEKDREELTKDILQKIAQVNQNHGLTPRYMPKTEKSKQMQNKIFSNPILEYLQREKNSGLRTGAQSENEEPKEEVPKGHYIKRKITHKQTYVIPNPELNFNPGSMDLQNNPVLDPVYEDSNTSEDQAKQQFLINNIRSIISNAQSPPFSNTFNPYMPFGQPSQYNQFMPNPYQNPYLRLNPYQNPMTSINPFNTPNPVYDTHLANLQTYKNENSRNFELFSHSNQKVDTPQKPERNYRPQRVPPIPKPLEIKNVETKTDDFIPYSSSNERVGTQFVKLPEIQNPEVPRQLGPYQSLPDIQTSRQFNWPLSNYFPITIKDPVQTVYTAVTSLVEYGQKENDACERKSKNDVIAVRSGKGITFDEFDLELLKFLEDVMKEVEKDEEDTEEGVTEEEEEVTDEPSEAENQTEKDERTRKDIKLNKDETTIDSKEHKHEKENVETTETTSIKEKPAEESSELKEHIRISRSITFENSEKGRRIMKLLEHIKEDEAKNGPKGIIKYLEKVLNETKDTLEIEGIEITDSKTAKQMTKLNKGNLKQGEDKFLDKTNSGSGIFINRLKVRKGGVAIAGPGGIATAGSGGTAIVGPNGIAYTQPNGVAIAGPGSKVIAVEPGVDLNKFVLNLTRNDGSTPRIGKVVAIGPVVYYNRG